MEVKMEMHGDGVAPDRHPCATKYTKQIKMPFI